MINFTQEFSVYKIYEWEMSMTLRMNTATPMVKPVTTGGNGTFLARDLSS